jgi:hypothetical protein
MLKVHENKGYIFNLSHAIHRHFLMHPIYYNGYPLPGTRSKPSTNNHRMPNIPLQSNLEIGSMVEVLSKNQKPKYGVIRWTGFVPNTDKEIAGLELVSYMFSLCTDTTFIKFP